MSTIKDVAEYAGVSKTLVSRYINKQSGVGAETGERIAEAIQKLNYRPNALARSLIQRRTYCIGVAVDDLSSTFIVPLIDGFEQGVSGISSPREYNVLYTNSCGDIQKKQRQLDFLTQGHVDGVVIYGSFIPEDDLVRHLAASNFPLVLIENSLQDLNVNKVLIDNVGGAFAATEHLIMQGHRKIAHFGGDMNLKVTLDRMNGYVQALQKYGIRVTPEMMFFPNLSEDDNWRKNSAARSLFYNCGYEQMKALIQKNQIPEAIFFATDISAYGAVQALTEAGLRVPEDVSIIGFDDESAASSLYDAAPVTTMRQPLREAGETGIRLLIQALENPGAPVESKMLYTQLIERGTTAPRGAAR